MRVINRNYLISKLSGLKTVAQANYYLAPMMRRTLSIFALLIVLNTIAHAQPKIVKKIKKEVENAQKSKDFANGFIGFCLMDAQSGKVIYESNGGKSFVTASAMKTVTVGAALALLGDTFRFKTELWYRGEIKNGILNGNIFIKGGMDPTTGSDRWAQTNMDSISAFFINALKKLGIRQVNGNIFATQSWLLRDNIPPGYDVGDLPYRYGAPPYKLNYRENYFEIGYDTLLTPDLYNPNILHDTVVTKFYSPYKGPGIPNTTKPEDLFIEKLQENMQKAGITVLHEKYDDDDNGDGIYRTIITYYSPSLEEIATQTQQQSINLYAECILRAVALNRWSTIDTSAAVVQRFWKNEKLDLTGLRMTDGSGLSRSNLCTPKLFCQMLSAYTKRPNFNSFYNTFAVAGQSGTVSNFAKGTKAEGNARIKTGTMSRVKSYIGYVTGPNGGLYTFAIMFNNFSPDASPAAVASKIVPLIAQMKQAKVFKVKVN